MLRTTRSIGRAFVWSWASENRGGQQRALDFSHFRSRELGAFLGISGFRIGDRRIGGVWVVTLKAFKSHRNLEQFKLSNDCLKIPLVGIWVHVILGFRMKIPASETV